MAGVVGSGCRKLFSNPRQRGGAGVVGVPARGWPCSQRPCSCSSRNVQRPPAWWQRSSTSAAAAASSSGSSGSSFTMLRPKPKHSAHIEHFILLHIAIYLYPIFSSAILYQGLETDSFKVNDNMGILNLPEGRTAQVAGNPHQRT